jgi:diaminopimelate epimerase
MIPFTKAHAYGNDFLYVELKTVEGRDAAVAARRLCDRHRGVGADGLILYSPTPLGASMKLLNADGSPAELSGNGLRGLAAILIRARDRQGTTVNPVLEVETSAGVRLLTLEQRDGARYVFAAEMGAPTDVREERIEAAGEWLTVSTLSMGNPQCVVLGPLPDDQRFYRLGPALERHPRFPARTNVAFALIERPDRVRIRIWERGVGPTESSGTGSCAAAVAAAAHGGARRRVEVIAPGGTQTVEWKPDGVVLTGWAEITCDGLFIADV